MGWVVNTTPRPLYPPKIAPVCIAERVCGPQSSFGRVRRAENLLQPSGFGPQTDQAVAIRYTH
jgi:hypothetical protein